MPTVSVIVCAYTDDRWDALECCVRAIERQTQPPEEVVLVVDHNPGLLVRCRTRFPTLTVVENRYTRGLSGARNTGVAAARGEVLAFVDEDAAPAPNWVAAITERYADARVLAVGGAIMPRWLGARPAWFPDEFLWVVGCTYRGMPERPAPVRNLIGCNMSVRSDVLQAIGGFRVGRVGALSIGNENDETELCLRIHRTFDDAVVLYDPDVRVLDHRVPAERARFSYFARRCFSEGLSKSRLASTAGDAALSTERRYVTHTLRNGIVRGVAGVALGRPKDGLRAVAIGLGLTFTLGGFAWGALRRTLGIDPARADAVTERRGRLRRRCRGGSREAGGRAGATTSRSAR